MSKVISRELVVEILVFEQSSFASILELPCDSPTSQETLKIEIRGRFSLDIVTQHLMPIGLPHTYQANEVHNIKTQFRNK